MSEFTWKPATTPPPLPPNRITPELTLPDPVAPGAATEPPALTATPPATPSDTGAGQWTMSASDRLLPDAGEQSRRTRGSRTAVAAAVAVIAGVLMVEMVRRAPSEPSPQPAVASKPATPSSTVATIEPVKPQPGPPAANASAGQLETAQAKTSDASAPKPDPKAIDKIEPTTEARPPEPPAQVAAAPSQAPETGKAVAPPPEVAKAPATPPTINATTKAVGAKEQPKAALQTGSLPAAAKSAPPTPKVLNAQPPAGTAASQATSAARSAAAGTASQTKQAPRPAPANDAYSPQPVEPPMRTAAAPRGPANDAYSPRSVERLEREELPPVRPAPAVGPIAGMPMPSAPRSITDEAPDDDGYADAPDRRGPPPDARDYWRSAPPNERPRFQTSSRPLAPPSVDSRDPYQVRAMAVGLHPQTQPDLLRRLSSADYRNANIAIQTALAETPDGRSFVWPRQELPEQATYLVRVGRGREPGCRRYVVKIEKEGRTVTTPEMETCSGR